jgi:hypothetical protein
MARRLTDQEGQRLLRLVRRGRSDSVRYRRALIIMASASGTTPVAIARLVAADADAVRDVINAFDAKGLAAPDLNGREAVPAGSLTTTSRTSPRRPRSGRRGSVGPSPAGA